MTRADRLTAALLKCGAATQDEITSGQWAGGQCPFSIATTPSGGRRLTIDKGDVLIRVSGATLEDAIAAFEAKVGG
jgi:hypothetical protein